MPEEIIDEKQAIEEITDLTKEVENSMRVFNRAMNKDKEEDERTEEDPDALLNELG